MATLPNKFEAHKKATAATKKKPELPEELVKQVLKAIDAGKMHVLLDVKADMDHVEACFKAQGYDVKWITTGRNKTSLQVSWA